MAKNTTGSFYSLETISGILLFFAVILAIAIANSPLEQLYNAILRSNFNIALGNYNLSQNIQHWINDGLMAIYFLLIGLEIKREINRGILQNKSSILTPIACALSGLILPALIYIYFNFDNTIGIKGWAIPTATDIAFTLGIVSMLKKNVPLSLKILLTAIAMFDDIGAIAIIAIFYTSELSYTSLMVSLICTIILIIFNYQGIKRISIYMVVGFILWVSVLESGVHATLAGIIIALTIPDEKKNSTLQRLEDGLHPWIVFVILPIFAFANAGISFSGFSISLFSNSVVLGSALGLFIGKQIGIFFPLLYFIKQNKQLSREITTRQVYGVALICGIGFTMSLFIGSLAFGENEEYMKLIKLGVFSGSILSAIAGTIVLTKKSLKSNL